MFELASVLILGIFAQWLAWRTKVPAILPLIIIGLLVGPLSTYVTEDGLKWIEPMFKKDLDHGIFPGEILFDFVTLSIGIILFEGGLTLKKSEIQGVGPVIIKLVTIGSVVTFFGSSLLAHYVAGFNWDISFVFSSLIIVTGPTVIAPILRHLPLKKEPATILKWEGILIDPIGALVAILIFEFFITGAHSEYLTKHVLRAFMTIIVIGTSVGFTAAYALSFALKNKMIPHYLINVAVLAIVLGVFVGSDEMAKESGLLAVVVMGMVLGNLNAPELKGILDFKESLSLLLISMLFIFLSANIEIQQLMYLMDWRIAALFLGLILLVRPLNIFLSTLNSPLSTNEKLFISWVGPRGIVAAGIASLFGMKLQGVIEGAEYITPLVFMVVLGTVLVNATTTKFVAKKLGVYIEKSDGILMVGANNAALLISKYLQQQNRKVVLVDSNKEKIRTAKQMGLNAFVVNIYTDDLNDNIELNDIGYLMALTENPNVNKYVCSHFKENFGEKGHYRLLTSDEVVGRETQLPVEGLFSKSDDFLNLQEVARDFPFLRAIPVLNKEEFLSIMDNLHKHKNCIPIFYQLQNDSLEVVTALSHDKYNDQLKAIIYMGEEVEIEIPEAIKDDSV